MASRGVISSVCQVSIVSTVCNKHVPFNDVHNLLQSFVLQH